MAQHLALSRPKTDQNLTPSSANVVLSVLPSKLPLPAPPVMSARSFTINGITYTIAPSMAPMITAAPMAFITPVTDDSALSAISTTDAADYKFHAYLAVEGPL